MYERAKHICIANAVDRERCRCSFFLDAAQRNMLAALTLFLDRNPPLNSLSLLHSLSPFIERFSSHSVQFFFFSMISFLSHFSFHLNRHWLGRWYWINIPTESRFFLKIRSTIRMLAIKINTVEWSSKANLHSIRYFSRFFCIIPFLH